MQLTRRGDYALRAMVDLATFNKDSFVLSKEIAQRQRIPPKFLAQVMMDLSRAGLVQAVRGAGGGFKLGKDLKEINIKEIVEAVEGPIALNLCLVREGACELDKECSLYPIWDRAQKRMLEVLERTTLKGLIQSAANRREKNRVKLKTQSEKLKTTT